MVALAGLFVNIVINRNVFYPMLLVSRRGLNVHAKHNRTVLWLNIHLLKLISKLVEQYIFFYFISFF